jgi:hypothetical protein
MTAVEKNNDIVVEFYAGGKEDIDEAIPIDEGVLENDRFPLGLNSQIETEIPPRAGDKLPRVESGETATEDQDDVVKVILPTGYVIEGETDLRLTIEK